MTEVPLDVPQGHDDLDGVRPPAATEFVAGHETALRELEGAYRAGRMHHAWLLQGPRGIGKASAAFAFTRRLLEQSGQGDRQQIFRQVAQGSHPNLLHLTRPAADRGGGFRTQITVDEVRRLNRFFQSTAGEAGWRVAIVDPVDDMNRSAANALLKILEEPPVRSLFLIVNHSAGRLLPTIRSRCRLIRFGPLAMPDLEAALNAALPGRDGAELRRAAEQGQGSVRRAIGLLESGGLEIQGVLSGLMALERPDWNAFQGLLDKVTVKGREGAYETLLEGVLDAVASESRQQLVSGDAASAARLAAFHAEESVRLRTAAAYNLDRKQVALTLFAGYFDRRPSTGGRRAAH